MNSCEENMKKKKTNSIAKRIISSICILVVLLFLIGCTNKTIQFRNGEGNLTFSIQDLNIEKTRGAFGMQVITIKGICKNERDVTYSEIYIAVDFFDGRGEKLDTTYSKNYKNIKAHEKFPFEMEYFNTYSYDIDIDKTLFSICRYE